MISPYDIAAVELAGDAENMAALDAEQHRLDAQEARERFVQEHAAFLTQPGEDYDPFTFQNFYEAVTNAPAAMQEKVWAAICTAFDCNGSVDIANHLALAMLKRMVTDYWWHAAEVEANRHFDHNRDFIDIV